MGMAAWSTYDEGYLQAYLWASSLAAGAALPREATALPLGPSEIAHAHLAPVGVFGHFGEQKDYRRSFLLVGGPVGLALTGAASYAHNQSDRTRSPGAGRRLWPLRRAEGLSTLVPAGRRPRRAGPHRRCQLCAQSVEEGPGEAGRDPELARTRRRR